MVKEADKGRHHGNMEFLRNVYASILTRNFKQTKLYIADALCDYSDTAPLSIPQK